MKTPTVGHVIGLIEEIAPVATAVAGDPVGLQCGNPATPVRKVFFSLDAGTAVIGQAVRGGADLLVTHHPMIFAPLDHRAVSGTAGKPLIAAVRAGLSVYSAHTNLDASPHGINAALARAAEMRETVVLLPAGCGRRFKVVTFVPPRSLEEVRRVSFRAGAGRIGAYSSCSFSAAGSGTFLGEEGSGPAVGEPGRFEEVPEARLEVLVEEELLARVLDRVRAAHPYEEPAVDVYPLETSVGSAGLGLLGIMPGSPSVGEIASRLKTRLKSSGMRLVGKPGRRVKTVAVCAGSGSSLMEAAVAAGAELFITGDMKYHDARTAAEEGLSVLDIGHFAPEKYGMRRFASLLARQMVRKGWRVESAIARENDPFTFLP